MLSSLLGRSLVERAKAITIATLGGLLLLSLWQVSTENALAARQSRDHQAAADVARQFASALTTYDYAHPNIQRLKLEDLSSADVRDRVLASSAEIASAKGSSLGDATDAVVISTGTDSQIEVLVRTNQVVASVYVGAGTELAGLLDVTLGRTDGTWLVVTYRWLLAPGGAP